MNFDHRDPKRTPAVGDVFKTTTPKGNTLFRVVIDVVMHGVVCCRGPQPHGPAKPEAWSTWRAYARRAEYVKPEEVPDEL